MEIIEENIREKREMDFRRRQILEKQQQLQDITSGQSYTAAKRHAEMANMPKIPVAANS